MQKLLARCSLLALWLENLSDDISSVTWHAAMNGCQMWICCGAFAVHPPCSLHHMGSKADRCLWWHCILFRSHNVHTRSHTHTQTLTCLTPTELHIICSGSPKQRYVQTVKYSDSKHEKKWRALFMKKWRRELKKKSSWAFSQIKAASF